MEGFKAVVCALNSKYIHSSLAPWYLKAAVQDPLIEVIVEEGTINEDSSQVLKRLITHKPRVLGFSTYIWNIEYITELMPELHRALPDTIIAFGGPEASYRARELLLSCPELDYVLAGEGEEPFPAFLKAIRDKENPKGISGLCSREYSSPPHISTKEPPRPYTKEYLTALKGRIAYAETSRGCPFSCSFCLSGRCGPARFFSLQRAKEDLVLLAGSGAKTIKLVDRTFNANPRRAAQLIAWLCEEYGKAIPRDVRFHLEIGGDILTPRLIELFSTCPKGLFQLELGLQSFNPKTLDAVNRPTDIEKLTKNIKSLLKHGRVHVHIDLIAGLPQEGLKEFKPGFDTAFSLKAHMLQLGFLKLLPGSPMAKAPQGSFLSTAPYEVVETPFLKAEELCELKAVESALDKLWNSGRFTQSLLYILEKENGSAYDFFRDFSEYAGSLGGKTPADMAALLLGFAQPRISAPKLRDRLREDLLCAGSCGKLPPFLWQQGQGARHKYLDSHPKTRRRPGIKRAVFTLEATGEILYVDYENPDELTGRYKINREDECVMSCNEKKAFVVGVSGASGSGKTTFAGELVKLLPGAYYLSADSYYKQELPIMISPIDGKEYPDWNHPTSLNLEPLLEEFKRAMAEEKIVVLEGAFIFCIPQLLEHMDFKLFLDATIETRLFRRISRNLVDRGHSLDFIGSYYLNCARFREKQFSLPSKYQADMVIDNENGFRGMEHEAAKIIMRKAAGE